VLACYNDADIVERTLAALARQSCLNFEIVVADDGSREPYAPLLARCAAQFSFPIQHVRHEDLGFRKARILNRAVHVSRFDRLIFLDMDCLPHSAFVRNHLRFVRPGTTITGRRVHIERAVTPSAAGIAARGVDMGALTLLRLWLAGQATCIEHGVLLPEMFESSRRAILGSNFSIAKSDLESINGFNEEVQGAGWEDADVDRRLQLAGVKIRDLKNLVIQYHVTHAQRVGNTEESQKRFDEMKSQRVLRAPKGLAEIVPGDFERFEYGAAR
jgi:cellulose synthase/poly-beta-1,6-N-acetylglucosamine synthase-like glycosyltransferase